MTERFESERPLPDSPVLDYFNKIKRPMSNPERDSLMAISSLCEKISGELPSQQLLKYLLYEPDGTGLASLERLATYPIVVFGEMMELTLPLGDVAVEYSRAMRGLLVICAQRHNENCAGGPCLSAKPVSDQPESFCPIMDCVDFLGEGVILVNSAEVGYQVDPFRQARLVEMRAKALASSSPTFASTYQIYINDYQNKLKDQLGDDLTR